MNPALSFEYTNYKGDTSIRHVTNATIVFKSSVYHNNGNDTWLMIAKDLDKGAQREFHLKDIVKFL